MCALLEAAEAAGKDKWLVQTAGGSALGRQVISMAKHRGIKLVSLVRRAAQKDELLQLGCAHETFPWHKAWAILRGLACMQLSVQRPCIACIWHDDVAACSQTSADLTVDQVPATLSSDGMPRTDAVVATDGSVGDVTAKILEATGML